MALAKPAAFKPMKSISPRDFTRLKETIKNPPRASEALKERMAKAKLSIKAK